MVPVEPMNNKRTKMTFSRRLALTVFVGLLAFFIGYEFAIFEALPAQVARHFDGTGKPDGWSSKNAYVFFNIGLQIFIFVLFALFPFTLRFFPNWSINIPDRDYWLAPERRAATLDRIGNFMIWIGVLTVGWFFAVVYMVDRFNIGNFQKLSNGFWIILGVYLGVLTLATILFCVRFYRHDPPSDLNSE